MGSWGSGDIHQIWDAPNPTRALLNKQALDIFGFSNRRRRVDCRIFAVEGFRLHNFGSKIVRNNFKCAILENFEDLSKICSKNNQNCILGPFWTNISLGTEAQAVSNVYQDIQTQQFSVLKFISGLKYPPFEQYDMKLQKCTKMQGLGGSWVSVSKASIFLPLQHQMFKLFSSLG